jgi:TonB family protein
MSLSSTLFSQDNVDTPISFKFNDILLNIKHNEKTNSLAGKIVVNVFVSSKGELSKIETVVSDNKDLEQIVIKAIKDYNNFTPAKKNGVFVDSYIKIPFVFSANSGVNNLSFHNANPEIDEIKLDKYPGIDMNKLMSNVKYPEEAYKNKIEGKVITSVLINEVGNVEEIKIESSDNPIFNSAIEDAIKSYGRFSPAEKDNLPVKSWVSIPFSFNIQEKEVQKEKPKQVDAKIDLNKLQTYIKYPEEAKKKEIQGKVIIKVLLDETGKFTKYEIEYSDNELLNEAALNAVKKYGKAESPTKLDGKPASSWIYLPIQFRLK